MHPLSDETLSAFLNARLDAGAEAEVRAHLEACPACAARARAHLAWRDELAGAWEEGRRKPAPRWQWKAAAAAVLLAAGGSLFLKGRVEETKATRSSIPCLSLETSTSGAELIAAPGSRVERKGEGWDLLSGSCLACGTARVSVGGRTVDLFDGEALVRIVPASASASLFRDAWAAEPAFEVAVYSGRVEVSGGLKASAGRVVGSDGSQRALSEADRSGRIPVPASPEKKLLKGKASWTLPAPGNYLVSVRVRLLDPKARAALVFEEGGRPSFWLPEGLPADGSWHTLEARLSSSWIAFARDGLPVRRFTRAGFQPNPAAEVPGAGVAVWDGSAEAEGLQVVELR